MKRIICLVLTLCYLFSSVGVSAKSMYCLGMLRSTTISYSIAPKKADCKMVHRTTTRKCCTTKTELLKVKDQHTYTGPMDLLAKFFPVLFALAIRLRQLAKALLLPQNITTAMHRRPHPRRPMC